MSSTNSRGARRERPAARTSATTYAVERVILTAGWHTSLAQFSRATGLAVSLYDAELELRAGPFTPGPLAARLAADGCWTGTGVCLDVDRSVAREALDRVSVTHHRGLDSMALFAVPVIHETECLGAIVAGWAFDSFPDPVATDRLASRLGMSFAELWHIVRQQPPVSAEKMVTYAELLQTVAELYVRERAETLREQDQSRGLRALYHSAQRLAAAATLEEIGLAAIEAVTDLVDARGVRLLVPENDGWREAAADDIARHAMDRGLHGPGSMVSTLRVPIESGDGTLLAILEIQDGDRLTEGRRRTQIAALAAQTAVALHKTTLIVELKREREALSKANRAKDLFLATLSHELRTPLTPIINWVALLSEVPSDPAGMLATGLEAIDRCARQELHLVEEMLDLTRILNNKIVLEPKPVDVTHLLTTAAASARPAASARSITLSVAADPRLPHIVGDEKRLHQVLSNLLSNAIKFSPDGGTVQLEARPELDSVEISVTDSGDGIPQEELGNVFELFHQVDSSSRRKHGGLGIGLTVVKGLVELHGGRIDVISHAGEGSSFRLRLPSAPAQATGAATAVNADADETAKLDGSLRGSVLIVDDSIDTLVSIALLLERAGYTVRTATSARDGLDAALRETPDLIISDLGMPELDGHDFLRMLREVDALRHINVIALTGFATLQDREAALEAGFAAHLPKPVDLPVLLRVMQKMMPAAAAEKHGLRPAPLPSREERQ